MDDYIKIIHEYYDRGHPEGYTDDLGIIADRNQWVNAKLPGWYFSMPSDYVDTIYEWCDNNLTGYWTCDHKPALALDTYYICSRSDMTLFKMTWG